MAAAVLTVLMQRTDTTNFIYYHRAAPSVPNSHSLQSRERNRRSPSAQERRWFPSAAGNHPSVWHVMKWKITCMFLLNVVRTHTLSCKNSPAQNETWLQITIPLQWTFHHLQFSSKLQTRPLWPTFIQCSLSATPQDLSIHSQIFCFCVILSALSTQRCLKYHFSHILTWELNHLQLRDQDAAADADGSLGDVMLPGVSQVCLTQ